MANNKLLTFSSSPHIKNPRTTRQIMMHVCIALLPACIMAVVYFGLPALFIILVSLISAVLAEYIYLLITGKTTKEILAQFDCSSCVTGILIALTLGPKTPLYIPVLASAFAIVVVKMLFGGTGNNLVNPAITGRVFAFMSFTSILANAFVAPSINSLVGGNTFSATTGATTLTGIFTDGNLPTLSNLDLLLGTGLAGCIGETCKVALLVGALYLAIVGIINIGYPILCVVVTGLMTVCLNNLRFEYFLPSILSGGLILGAFFMATDYTTSPNTTLGNIIYFALLGLLTAVLRQATGIETFSFILLLMNITVPLLDKFILPKPFGYKKSKQGGAKK